MAFRRRRRVAGRVVRSEAAGQRFHHLIGIAAKEEGHGIALAMGCIDDPMDGRPVEIVSPPREHVAEIDEEGSRHRIGMDPSDAPVVDLEAADVVLQQDGERVPIGVGAGSLFPGCGVGRLGRVFAPICCTRVLLGPAGGRRNMKSSGFTMSARSMCGRCPARSIG